MKPPHGLVEVRRVFGDPRGIPEPEWRKQILAPVQLPYAVGTLAGPSISRLYVHKLLVEEVDGVFRDLAMEGHVLRTVGCYAFREKRGLTKLSTHCWAIALDVNAATNRLGTVGDMDPRVVAIFEERGWRWGGRWKRRDPMHFQFATGI